MFVVLESNMCVVDCLSECPGGWGIAQGFGGVGVDEGGVAECEIWPFAGETK